MDESVEPFSYGILLFQSGFSIGSIAGLLALLILLLLSGLISGSEVAYFSLDPSKHKELEDLSTKRSELALTLLLKSKELLATILISNNFVNVAIILLSSLLTEELFSFQDTAIAGVAISATWIAFAVDVIGITFLILLFGEVIPKIYASRYPLDLALFMAYPITVFYRFFNQLKLVPLLVSSSKFIDKTIKKRNSGISVDELSHALDITDKEDIGEEDHKILKGIVKFGNTDVRQIMTSRVDVTGFDLTTPYDELLNQVLESGYSRIPVFEDDFDNIKGVLYLKDLLPFLQKDPSTFQWNELIREPFFVPEKKKIDDLLNEFRERKMHMAIVVDEYGGSQGIVTLEDVIEEIVGDISDEFDDEDLVYSKLDDNNVVFEGKTALNDVYRVLGIDGTELESVKGESDTLAGIIIEHAGRIPKKNEKLEIVGFKFTVEAADKKRVKRVKVTLPESQTKKKKKSNSGELSMLILLLPILTLLTASCEETFFPKPKSYYRIEMEEPNYDTLQKDCPFTFEYNTALSQIDYTRVKPSEKENCWFNIYYPALKARIHFSYFNDYVADSLSNYTETSRKLAMKHVVKAKDIKENRIYAPVEKVYGLTYDFEGSTASAFQFFVTDSVNHYVHASLYFETYPNPDSLKPAEAYVKEDLYRIIESFEWK